MMRELTKRERHSAANGRLARKGVKPDTAYDDRLGYPQSEIPGALYHAAS
jgi:hypothetical protein